MPCKEIVNFSPKHGTRGQNLKTEKRRENARALHFYLIPKKEQAT